MAPARDENLKNLAVFDFDWSMVEQDSDYWTLMKISPETYQWVLQQKTNIQWTDLMAAALSRLHDQGVKPTDIHQALEQIPFSPAMKEILERLHNNNTTVIILSDANTVFIDSILKAKGASKYIDKIVTNPGRFAEDGKLVVERLIAKDGPQHNCSNGCAANICKGRELTKFLEEAGPFKRIMYVGDGKNDYCPATLLAADDKLFARTGKSLDALLKSRPELAESFKSEVQYWSDPQEILTSVIQEKW
ncbi:hypothetical protein VKS41_002216 [Umbelopsis sp. WA50703]